MPRKRAPRKRSMRSGARSPSPTPRSRIERASGLSLPATVAMNAEISADFQDRAMGTSGDREHPVQRQPCLGQDRLGYPDLVHHLAGGEVLEHVEQVLGIDAVHGRAETDAGQEGGHRLVRVLLLQTVHQM